MIRAKTVFALLLVVVATFAMADTKTKLIGVWTPTIKHGKLTGEVKKKVAAAKELVKDSSLKLHSDGTFGTKLGQFMFGKYTIKGTLLTLRVTSIVGMSDKEVAKLPASRKIAKYRISKDAKTLTAIEADKTKPVLIWKKSGK